jgi:benzodiazapine receptor
MDLIPAQDTYSWYRQLRKPFFAPPSWVFGAAWSILYPIIFISFSYVFYKILKKPAKSRSASGGKIPGKVATPFILNLLSNFFFTPIQFNLQNNFLAAVDISLVIITLLWAIKTVYPYSRTIAYLQIPYLIWGLFATLLQFSITLLN